MKKKVRKEQAVGQFIEAAKSYIAKRGTEAEIDGEVVRCAMVIEGRGYDVALSCDPKTSRVNCEALICNVFPESKREAVISFLSAVVTTPGEIGGTIGISKTARDLTWMTFCQLRKASVIGEALIEEVLTLGVGSFDQTVKQVQQFLFETGPTINFNNWGIDPKSN
jgi:hypothetical protein